MKTKDPAIDRGDSALIDAEYRAAQNEFWVLERIRQTELEQYPEDVPYWQLDKVRICSLRNSTMFTGKGAPTPETQSTILFNLEDRHAIRVVSNDSVKRDRKKISYLTFEILHPGFDQYYEKCKRNLPVEVLHGDNRADTLLVFTLTKDGTLARKEPFSDDTPYTMDKESRRHRAIKALASSKSEKYIPTPDLAETVNCTEDQFRKTCGEIRRQINDHFTGVKSRDVIDAKGRSGYRINPKARIITIS